MLGHTNPIRRHPACPVCEGRGVLDGVDVAYGTTADCEPCGGSGALTACAECCAPFRMGDRPVEVMTGRFVCDRCSREVYAPVPWRVSSRGGAS